jgi:hypothetical protein
LLEEPLRLGVVDEPRFERTQDRRILVDREVELSKLWIAAGERLFDQFPCEHRERDGGR